MSGAGANSTREVVLRQVPNLAAAYRGAVVNAVRDAAGRADRAAQLPAVTFVAPQVRFDREHLTAYQRLLGEPVNDVLPAGFVHVAAFPVAMSLMAAREFPLPLLGMVHIANRVEQHAPLTVTDTVAVRASAEHLRAHRRGALVDLVATVQRDGVTVWRGISTYLAKGANLAVQGEAAPHDGLHREAGRDGEASHATFVAPPVTATWRLPADIGRRYAAISGDRNPIHMSALSAKAFGFPRAIAHGMYSAARALAAVGSARDEAFEWDVAFDKPVLLPSTVAFGLERTDTGWRYAAWRPGDDRAHFTGAVRPR